MASAGATAIASGSGRALEVSYTLQIQAELSIQQTHVLVTGVTECERPELAQGIVVYFCRRRGDPIRCGKTLRHSPQRPASGLGGRQGRIGGGAAAVFLR